MQRYSTYSSYEDLAQAGPSTSIDYSEYCAYCHESLTDEYNPTRLTRCGHKLHLVCMNTFLPDRKKCPVCCTPIKWMNITDKCAICFDPIGDFMHKVIPNCDHEMHYDCLKQWFVTKKRCPVCRKSLMYMADTISDYEDNDEEDEEQVSEEQSDEVEEYSQSSNQYGSSYEQSSGTEDDYESYSDKEEVDFDYYEDNCFYCSKSFATTTQPQKRIRCGHIFHMRCANKNLPITKKCGVCRTYIPNWINTNDICVRCRGHFSPSQERFTSICQHEFHVSCAKNLKKKRCPLCRCKLEGKSSDAMCAICLESFPSVQDTYVTRCNHKFHNSCINSWKVVDNICPICRESL